MIKHNRIRCRKCGDTIESFSVHDFKSCKCGVVFVDGGHEYMRRGGDLEDINEEYQERLAELHWKKQEEEYAEAHS